MITIQHGLAQGQVLQRLKNGSADVCLEGTSSAGGPVEVRLLQSGRAVPKWGRKAAGKAARGKFSAKIKGLPVGGPYELVLKIGGEILNVTDIFVGDVWILAGQSNMEGCGSLAEPTLPNDRVRALYLNGQWGRAEDSLHEFEESPDSAHCQVRWPGRVMERLRALRTKGVGPGISFGSEMVRRSGGVPQGLIACAHGGTSMAQWDPRKKKLGGASFYGAMLRIWKETAQPVAGVLWYQGESDAQQSESGLYYRRMVELIRAFRKDLKQPKLPFLLAQLGKEFNVENDDDSWNQIQFAQTRLARELDRVACVAAIDLPMEDSIHLSSAGQARLGRRFAAEADRTVYGNRKELPQPEVESVRRLRTPKRYQSGTFGVEVTFKNIAGGLCFDGPVASFGLVDAAGNVTHPFYKAEAQGNKVRLEAWREPGKCSLVYGKGRKPSGLLVDGADRAVPVFGPVPVIDTIALSEPFGRWKVSEGQTGVVLAELKNAPRPDGLKLMECMRQTFVTAVPNPPAAISGIVCFFAEIDAPEPMRGDFWIGYDAPFKLWVDGKPFHTDLQGVNPVVIGEVVKPVKLGKGRHRLTAAVDLSNGVAWGFVLHFARTGLAPRRIQSGEYRLPQCL